MDKPINMLDYATKVCMGPRARYDVKCSRCGRIIGDTDDPTRTVDMCGTCKAQWVAELKREQNLLSTTMDTFHRLMAQEPVHPDFKAGLTVIKGGRHEV